MQGDAPLAALLAPPCARAPFDRLEWFRGLVEECGLFPLIAVARRGNDRAVLPLRRVQRRLEPLANWYSFAVKALETAPDDALLEELAADLAGEAPHVVLHPVPDENDEASRLAAAFRRAGWVVFRSQSDVNHVLHLRGRSFAEYLAARPGPLRTTLKRKAAKVAVTVETAFRADSWNAYEAVYAQSWKPQEGSPAFLRRFAQEEGAAGRLRLGIARAEGRPVAAQLWTVEGGTAFIHKLAHTEASRALSPGTTLSAALFEHAIDHDRVETIDFGTGDDPYKRDWMEEVRPRYRLEMFRPAWPGNWPLMARRMLSGLARRGNHG